MLALEIEYLSGTVVAATGPTEADNVDWPPQPDRVFSALVASWGARGESAAERKALEWLERQSAPRIIAGQIAKRKASVVYVPPNDFRTSSAGFDVLPARRQKQPRYFRSGHTGEVMVKFIWPDSPAPEIFADLDKLARDTAYLGHSSSFTRCRFTEGDYDLRDSEAPKYAVYPGRLEELERLYHVGERTGHGNIVVSDPRSLQADDDRSVFSTDWIVLADDGGRAPDLRAAPLVAKVVRDALMGAYERLHELAVPEWLSGHTPDGSPSTAPHAAFIPLADVGWKHSEGRRLMGFAIVLPRDVKPEALFDTIGALLRRDVDSPGIVLQCGGSRPWILFPSLGPVVEKPSLSPSRYTRRSTLWATATPIALDRYPKRRAPEERTREIAEQLAIACENIGLPRPSYVGVDVSPMVNGAPPSIVPADAPTWQRWQLPRSLHGRSLTHAVIGFNEPIAGPVILGAGRYVGLGLCLGVNADGIA